MGDLGACAEYNEGCQREGKAVVQNRGSTVEDGRGGSVGRGFRAGGLLLCMSRD